MAEEERLASGRSVEVRWPEASVRDDPSREADTALNDTV